MGPTDSESGLCLCPQIQVPQIRSTMTSRRLVRPVPCLMPLQALRAVTVLTTSPPSVLSRRPGIEGRGPRVSHSGRPRRSLLHLPAVSHWSKMNQSFFQKVGLYCLKTRGPRAFAFPWNTKDITHPPQTLRVSQLHQPSKIQKVHSSPSTGI